MFTVKDPARGRFLLKKVEEAITALESAPESDQKTQKIASLEYLKYRLVDQIVVLPHGFAYLSLSPLEKDGRLEFPDWTEANMFQKVFLLVEKYGLPEEFNTVLTDEVAIELVEGAINDAEVWTYTKTLCAYELQSGGELPPLLLRFVGYALIAPLRKKKPGQSGHKNSSRNKFLATIGEGLQSHFNLPFTRGAGSRSDSVCSVLSETMEIFGLYMSETTIRKAIEKGKADNQINVNNPEGIVSSD